MSDEIQEYKVSIPAKGTITLRVETTSEQRAREIANRILTRRAPYVSETSQLTPIGLGIDQNPVHARAADYTEIALFALRAEGAQFGDAKTVSSAEVACANLMAAIRTLDPSGTICRDVAELYGWRVTKITNK